jgi:hypothetical protein
MTGSARPTLLRENPVQASSPNGTNRAFPNGHGDTEPVPDTPGGPAPAPPAAADGSGGRDGRGRFARGNPGGPGNPFARRVALLRRALLAAVGEEDLEAVARRLVAQAREGDTAAARLLLAYTLGKPGGAVDPDTLDLQEWQLYRQRPVAGPDLLRVLTNLPADAACAILRAALPGVADGMLRLLAEALARQAQEEQQAAARPRRARPRRRPAGGPAAEGTADRAVPAGPAREGPTAPEQGNGSAAGGGPAPAGGGRPEERAPAPPGQGGAPAAAAGAGQPATGAAMQDTIPPAAAGVSRQSVMPADAVPDNVARLRERDTELRRALQTLLSGLGSVEGANPGGAPTANGTNGCQDTGPPAAAGG